MNAHEPDQVLRIAVAADAPCREALAELVGAQIDMVCVAALEQPELLEQRLNKLRPDLLLLDLAWGEDALRIIGRMMVEQPLPIVALDTGVPTPPARLRAELALARGAVSLLPPFDEKLRDDAARGTLIRELRAAAGVPVIRRRGRSPVPPANLKTPIPPRPAIVKPTDRDLDFLLRPRSASLIAVGASTGGPPCIRTVLSQLHESSPPTLVVQHMPAAFMSGFADWLAQSLPVVVREARHGEQLRPGHVYVAPGDRHLVLDPRGVLGVVEGEPIAYQRPSVDVLFYSVAEHAMRNAVGVLLTGMGWDGAEGLLAMRRRGHTTIAQDEHSSLVFGMPRAAVEAGAAEHIASPLTIAESLARLVHLAEPTHQKVEAP